MTTTPPAAAGHPLLRWLARATALTALAVATAVVFGWWLACQLLTGLITVVRAGFGAP